MSTENEIIEQAIKILESKAKYHNISFTDPDSVKKYLRLKIGGLEHEVFTVLFLNNAHKLIEAENMFRGTIDGASVYPREVYKKALKLNAAALIFAHNHPSGSVDPSGADKAITMKLQEAGNLFDIRVLDHFIVSGTNAYSFAENGLI